MESLSDFQPKTGSVEDWNNAYTRVEDYLRALRVDNKLHKHRLIRAALDRAAARHAQTPDMQPMVLAVEEMETIVSDWFSTLIADETEGEESEVLPSHGKAAMLVADLPARWPYLFSDPDRLPSELRTLMRETTLRAGPSLQLSSMVSRDIELGLISEAAGRTLEGFQRWPIIRTLLLWAIFLAMLMGLFLFIHN